MVRWWFRAFATVVIVTSTGACIRSNLERCGDAVCGLGEVCEVGVGCVDPAECEGPGKDGNSCGTNGVCLGGTCIPAACGNAVKEPSEECDDGNLASHDGCSSTCLTEAPTWTRLAPASAPPAREHHAMAYDAGRGRIVLFGGITMGLTRIGDTWEWDGASWHPVESAPSPPARAYHALAYDTARRRIVLFGGRDSLTMPLGDTWTWNGSAWSLAASTGPSPRAWAQLADDAGRGRVIVAGGDEGVNMLNGETWAWDGTSWSLLLGDTPELRRYGHRMTAAASRGRLSLFGGRTSAICCSRETVEWDGSSWSPAMQVGSWPSERESHAMAHHDLLGRSLLFGGTNAVGEGLSDTWEWDGAAWSVIPPVGVPPSSREGAAMAYHALRQAIVLFGGWEGGLAPTLADTWEYRYQRDGAPDESCVAGEDADGDGLAACDDPDCAGYCSPHCPPGVTCDPALPHCGDGTCNPDLETRVCPVDCF